MCAICCCYSTHTHTYRGKQKLKMMLIELRKLLADALIVYINIYLYDDIIAYLAIFIEFPTKNRIVRSNLIVLS